MKSQVTNCHLFASKGETGERQKLISLVVSVLTRPSLVSLLPLTEEKLSGFVKVQDRGESVPCCTTLLVRDDQAESLCV